MRATIIRPAFLSRSVSGTCVARGSLTPVIRKDRNDSELGFSNGAGDGNRTRV